jgi:Zn-dependent oligopeptidase
LDIPSFFLADMEDLKKFSKDQGALEADDLTHWDISFWSERLRESKYDINEVPLTLTHLKIHVEKTL